MTSTDINPDTCPVCGQSNRCTLADPRTVDRACWCFTETIDPAVLAALPEDVRNKACLCPRCAGLVEADQATLLQSRHIP
ncbi:cysteine-rich CWC family protein [Pseudomonas sp. NPDC088444]|uniref:cysteine-rich CWC family protein n=1 Tax=Pseudomonas sp. NPDC088444 TaxID=3364456 RepID=UPI00384AFB9B